MSYENPQRLYTGDTPAGAYLKQIQMQQNQRDAEEKQRKADTLRKQAEEKQLIQRMQRVQGDADVWNLEQMSNLATAPKTSAIQDELMKTLNSRIDIATQAQIYLKTQFGDSEKRNLAKKAIQDYYDLLNLTSKTTKNFVATGDYWKENAPQIGKKITILGDTPDEIANNQFLVNALGGIYSNANFEMVYDEEKNDIMVKVSGNEPQRLQDGKLIEGDYREKYISARAWDANVVQGDNFSFISTVPQLVNESIEMMKPADKTKNGNGLGIVGSNGQFANKYWSEPVIFRDRIQIEGSKRSRRTEEIRSYLNMDLVKQDMESILASKIKGVTSNVQQAANGWNVDLKKLDEGIENDYQTLQPSEQEYKDALFQQIMEARTNGLVQDSQGRWYKAQNKSITQPTGKGNGKTITPPGYRSEYYDNIIMADGDNNEDAIIENLTKITGPNSRYMSRDKAYSYWLSAPKNSKFPNGSTNEEYYEDKDEDPRAAFNKKLPKDGLYKYVNGQLRYAGDYDLNSAEERLNFALDNSTASERKVIDKSGLRLKAIKIDWMSNNPMRGMETPEGYALRMNEALKIKK